MRPARPSRSAEYVPKVDVNVIDAAGRFRKEAGRRQVDQHIFAAPDPQLAELEPLAEAIGLMDRP